VPSRLADLRPESAHAFTLVELLVVIAIIAILAAIAFPVAKSSMLSAKSAESVANLKQIGNLVAVYAADNNNCLPHAAVYQEIYGGRLVYFARSLAEAAIPGFIYGKKPYTDDRPLPAIFYDPCLEGTSRKQHPMGAFGVNSSIVRSAWYSYEPKTSLASIPRLSQKVIFCSVGSQGTEYASGWDFSGQKFSEQGMDVNPCPDPRNAGKAAALFADGHVEKLDVKNMKDEATRRRHFTLDP
jgi:prepilin-type N-terminal cleavage/methylation domain-containing protein/prepilin-type processing-associated H-X9-DG protein